MPNLRFNGSLIRTGFAPHSNLGQALADAVVDQCQDLIDQFIWLYLTEKDPERKVRYTASLVS